MPNNEKYLIYGLVQLNKQNEIRYIGRSSSGLKRPESHYSTSFLIANGKYKSELPINRWIRKNGKYNIKILEVLSNNISDKQEINKWLNETEIKLIKKYRKEGYKLLNLTAGGFGKLGIKGIKPSDEVRKKISNALSGRKLSKEHIQNISYASKGRKHSDKSKQKMSNAQKGKNNPMYGKKNKWGYHTKEAKQKMSNSLKSRTVWNEGKQRSKKTKEKISKANGKAIICLNDKKTFISGPQAAKYYKLDKSAINRVCRGLQKQTRAGYKFMFLINYNEK